MGLYETKRIVELPDSISFSRHANPARYSGPDNPLSKKYPSITEKGVKQAHMTVREELIPALEATPPDTVLFILAKSDQTRTGHTADAYGDEFDRIAQSRDDLFVLTKTKLSVQRGNTIIAITDIVFHKQLVAIFFDTVYFNGESPTSMTRDLPAGVSAPKAVNFRQSCSWAARRLGCSRGSRRTVTLCFSLFTQP